MFKFVKSGSENSLVEEINKMENVRVCAAYAQGYQHIAIVETVEPKAKPGRKAKDETETTQAPDGAESDS